MAMTDEEKAEQRKTLAEAFADGLAIFESRKEEAKAKEQTDSPNPPEDDKDKASAMDKLLGWIA